MEKMRLDKFLAAYTTLSRKEAKKAIRKGEVTIDGMAVESETQKVFTDQVITIRGEKIKAVRHIYLMLNKPQGVLSATKDREEKTVMDFLPDMGRPLFPVGRLDKDTEGFLLLTDDGALAHKLLSPAYHVAKTYEIEYSGNLADNAVSQVLQGIDIGEKHLTKPAELCLIEKGRARLTITEGKFHQVKRMISALGGKVTYLKRISMAGIMLDENLAKGDYRELTEEEVAVLQERHK